ncbi:MAG: hypothetical protein CME20_01870 [Gemmatimonadetes bacterium]|nr:hypothetical protein [Gemmatimonadota bacterium]
MSKFLDRLAADRPLIYDGGFGSELFARGIELTNSTLANEAHPDAVVDIHKAYIAAGADLIGTNTFVASELHLEMAGKDPDQAGALTRTATDLARRAIAESGRDVLVGGSIGPSPGAIEADAGSTDFGIANDRVKTAHQRIVEALYEGGIDFFSIETQFSATEAAMACQIARQTGLPIAINLTLKYTKDRKSGAVVYKTDWGHSPADLLDILAGGEYSDGDNLLDHVQVLGLNCGAETRRSEHTGMPYAISGVEQLKAAMADRGVAKKLMTYPNAGMPQLNSAHRTIYSQSPADMAQLVPDLAAAGAHIIGGCCGTTPDHIRAFRRAVDPN